MGAYVMMGLYFLQLPVLYHQNKTALNALFIGIGAALNLGLNIILIPRIGIMGAAIATAVAYAGMALGIRIWSHKKAKMKLHDLKLIVIMILTLLIFVVIRHIEIGYLLKLLISIAYLVMVYFIQPMKLKDVRERK